MFPSTALGVGVKLQLGTLGWVDITPDVRLETADSGGGINITRGRTNEGSDVDVARCRLVVNNRAGKYSPRNPSSPYYGLLGRNTPIMVTVGDVDPGGAVALSGYGAATVDRPALYTAPAAALDGKTGDLDVRAWLRMAPSQWRDQDGVMVAGRQTSWNVAVGTSGRLELRWSTDGVNEYARASAVIPDSLIAGDGSLAIRTVLNVTTGVPTWYTAPTIAGPWAQLGAAGVAGGVGLYDAAGQPVWLGDVPYIGSYAVNGELYGFEYRRGATLLTAPDFTQLQYGDTQLTDAQGRTWELRYGALAVERSARFVGEVAAWPQRWNPAGTDVWVPLEASGITRRLSQGNSPVQSALYRTLSQLPPTAYLPLEDGDQAARPTSAAAGVVATTAAAVTFGEAPAGLGGTAAVAKMNDATASITTQVVARPASTVCSFIGWFKLTALPAGSGDQVYARLYMAGGLVARWEFLVGPSNVYRWIGYDSGGSVVVNQAIGAPDQPPTEWLMVYVEFKQDGTSVDWQPWVANAGDTTFNTSPFTYVGAFGYPTRLELVGNPYFANGLWSHVAIADRTIFGTADFAMVSTGYAGEHAGDRIARVAAEYGLPVTFFGTPRDTLPVGPQPIAPLVDVMRDAAGVDGGTLLEARGHLGLHYRTRASMYNQRPTAALTYGHLSPALEPTDDDDQVRNDVEVKRRGGSAARAIATSGPLSTLDPPAGVGTYDTSETVNAYTDYQLPDLAGWLLRLGTVDESRYPRVRLNLANRQLVADQALTRAVVLADVGDVASLSGLPAWLPPGTPEIMVLGYAENLDARRWDLTWNAGPASPWDVAVVDADTRVAADGTQLAGATSGSSPAAATVWDFASGVQGWTPLGGTSTVTADGAGAIKLTPDGVTAAPEARSPILPIAAGATIRAAATVTCPVARNANVGIIWRNSTGGLLSSTSATFALPAGTPTPVSVVGTAPGGAVQAQATINESGTPPASNTLTIDDATLGEVQQVQITSTSANGAWTTDPADFPVDLRIGAERVTAVGITGTGLTQTVTVSARGLNGVIRAWPVGTDVDVWSPAYAAL